METHNSCTAVRVSIAAELLKTVDVEGASQQREKCSAMDKDTDTDTDTETERDQSHSLGLSFDTPVLVQRPPPLAVQALQRQVGTLQPRHAMPCEDEDDGPDPRQAAGSITVTVHSLAGSIVGLFNGFFPGSLVAELQAQLADTTETAAVTFQLLKGPTLLDGKATFAEAGISDGVELTICFLSAAGLVRAAQEALDACPEREPEDFDVQFITIANSGFRLAPQDSQAYKDWCTEEAPRVSRILQVLCNMEQEVREVAEEVARLALRCLWLPPPPHDRVLADMLAVGPVDELYPDELTLAALQLLPLCTQAEDRAVLRVLQLWLSRARLSGINPSFQTMEQVLHLLPGLATTGSQRRDMVAFLDWAACDLLNVDSSGRPRSGRGDMVRWEAFYGHLAPADICWWIRSCYQAMLQLLRSTRKDPKAPRFFYAWPALNLDIHELMDMSRDFGVRFKDEEQVLLAC